MTQKLRKRTLAARYDVTQRTIDRWTRDKELAFPQPLYVGSLPVWDEQEIVDWERSRAKPRRPQTQRQPSDAADAIPNQRRLASIGGAP